MKKLILIIAALSLLMLAGVTLSEKSFILYYHNVDTHKYGLKGAYISPNQFAWQMKYLKFRGYRAVSLEKLVAHLKTGKPLPRKIFAITFDDGNLNTYHNAFPLLHQLGYPATVFIPTDHIGKMIGYGDSAAEQRLSWDEIKIMSEEWDFGSHSLSHENFTAISPDQIRREITESRKILQKMLGKEIGLFCYPYGGDNEAAIGSLKDAGFQAAVSSDPGLIGTDANQNIYALQRIEWNGLFPFSIRTLWDLKFFYLKIILGV